MTVLRDTLTLEWASEPDEISQWTLEVGVTKEATMDQRTLALVRTPTGREVWVDWAKLFRLRAQLLPAVEGGQEHMEPWDLSNKTHRRRQMLRAHLPDEGPWANKLLQASDEMLCELLSCEQVWTATMLWARRQMGIMPQRSGS